MKRYNTILLIAFAALSLTACDPGYTCDDVINNQCGHEVRIIPMNYTVYRSHRDTSIHDTVYFSNVTDLFKGEKITVTATGGIGVASREECIYNMKRYLGDSVRFVFDRDKSVVFRATDTTGLSPYNFDADCYHYVQNLSVHHGKVGRPYYGTLTLNIVDAFYQMAQ